MEDVRKLIRENILPRLDNLDAEMYDLRMVTWPVCQGQRDMATGGLLTNINLKSKNKNNGSAPDRKVGHLTIAL